MHPVLKGPRGPNNTLFWHWISIPTHSLPPNSGKRTVLLGTGCPVSRLQAFQQYPCVFLTQKGEENDFQNRNHKQKEVLHKWGASWRKARYSLSLYLHHSTSLCSRGCTMLGEAGLRMDPVCKCPGYGSIDRDRGLAQSDQHEAHFVSVAFPSMSVVELVTKPHFRPSVGILMFGVCYPNLADFSSAKSCLIHR